MCGIFGFASKAGEGPDPRMLQKIARETQTRGPDAFGFAWVDDRGRLRAYKQTGRIVDHLGLLSMAASARLLIGHCRYATHGDPRFNVNNHPHACDGGWLVHNGVIRNYAELIEQHGLHPISRCDSEVLALLIEQFDGSREDRILATAGLAATGAMALMALWHNGLYALRAGNPLHLLETDEAYYLASLPGALGRHAFKVRDDSLLRFRLRKGKCSLTGFDASDSITTR